MCSVDRRWYRDGDFNGHWTSQLAPSQCSGTLFPLPILSSSPQCYPLSPLLSTFLSLPFFLALLFFLHIFLLIFLPVSPRFVFFLHRSTGPSSPSHLPLLSLFLFFSFLFPSQTPGLYATWKASGLKRDITGPSLASDTGTQKTEVLSYPRRSL